MTPGPPLGPGRLGTSADNGSDRWTQVRVARSRSRELTPVAREGAKPQGRGHTRSSVRCGGGCWKAGQVARGQARGCHNPPEPGCALKEMKNERCGRGRRRGEGRAERGPVRPGSWRAWGHRPERIQGADDFSVGHSELDACPGSEGHLLCSSV